MGEYQKLSGEVYAWDAYLKLEKESDTRHEYHDGSIVAMAGASNRHNEIATNFSFILKSATRKNGCKSYAMEVKLFRYQSPKYLYPDGMLTCQPLDLQTKNGVRSPLLVMEVLSDSSRTADRAFKLREYLKIPSLQHYVIIEQEYCEVQHFRRTEGEQWEILFYDELTQHLEIPELSMKLSLADLYEGIEFGPEIDLLQEESAEYETR